ncbi:MAG: hypothetical protein COA45_06005 [Zetaproteobacteria bacterium]|nr:MAG: hypothetical protein COA45_06005 [Zetaproteobacteria bacterium]
MDRKSNFKNMQEHETSDFGTKKQVFATNDYDEGVHVYTLDLYQTPPAQTNSENSKDKIGSLTMVYRLSDNEETGYTTSVNFPTDSALSSAFEDVINQDDMQSSFTKAPWKRIFNEADDHFQFDGSEPSTVISALQKANCLSEAQLEEAQAMATELSEIKQAPLPAQKQQQQQTEFADHGL